MLLKLSLKLIEQITTEFWVSDRATSEQDSQLHLVAAIEESRGLPTLGCKIGPANLGFDANFLEFGHVLIATRFSLFPALFVPKFAIIHQSTDGRVCVGRYLDEVQPFLPRHFERIPGLDDADLFTFIVY
jgi:hypothetical protein